jgi:hypothetical protein
MWDAPLERTHPFVGHGTQQGRRVHCVAECNGCGGGWGETDTFYGKELKVDVKRPLE